MEGAIYGDREYRVGGDEVFAVEPGKAASPYPLQGEAGTAPEARGPTPWRVAPARKVRTTLGLKRQEKPQQPVVLDHNARVAAAFRPGMVTGRPMHTVDEEQPAAATDRSEVSIRLRPLVAREESLTRALFVAIAVLFSGLFFWLMLGYSAPAHTGSDQNAYLLAGRLLAEQGTMRYLPPDPFAFVGSEWITTGRTAVTADGLEVQEFFPRHPPGLPLLYAACFRLAPESQTALAWAHMVIPACAALALLGMFFLGRFAGGSFLGILVMLALAGSQGMLQLSASPNSHVPALACATWGVVCLLWWWRNGRWRCAIPLGILAGLLLGYAFTIRYAEGLLVLPLVVACAFAWHWRRPFASTARVLIPLLAWVLPVAALLYYNHATMGLLTGYHATGEAGLFSRQNFLANWESMARQLNDAGLYLLLPLGVVGLLALCARRLRLGLVMLAWVVPAILVCTAYHWPTRGWGIDSLRFFLTMFPAILFGAAYLLRRVIYAPSDSPPQLAVRQDPYTGDTFPVLLEATPPLWRQLASPVVAGLVVAAAVGMGVHRAVAMPPANREMPAADPGLQALHHRHANAAELGRLVSRHVPAGSVVIMDATPPGLDDEIHHIQLIGGYEVYDARAFTNHFGRQFRGQWSAAGDNGPNPLQRERFEHLRGLYEEKSAAELSAEVQRIVDRALEEGRGAYLVMNGTDARRFRQTHLLRGYEAQTIATYHDLPLVRPGGPREEATGAAGQAMPRSVNGVAGEWSIVRLSRQPQISPAEERMPGNGAPE